MKNGQKIPTELMPKFFPCLSRDKFEAIFVLRKLYVGKNTHSSPTKRTMGLRDRRGKLEDLKGRMKLYRPASTTGEARIMAPSSRWRGQGWCSQR